MGDYEKGGAAERQPKKRTNSKLLYKLTAAIEGNCLKTDKSTFYRRTSFIGTGCSKKQRQP